MTTTAMRTNELIAMPRLPIPARQPLRSLLICGASHPGVLHRLTPEPIHRRGGAWALLCSNGLLASKTGKARRGTRTTQQRCASMCLLSSPFPCSAAALCLLFLLPRSLCCPYAWCLLDSWLLLACGSCCGSLYAMLYGRGRGAWPRGTGII